MSTIPIKEAMALGDPRTLAVRQPDALTQCERRELAESLEAGIAKGKVRPFAALEIAKKLNLPLAAWIKEQADYLAAQIAPVKPERCHTGDHRLSECPGDHGK